MLDAKVICPLAGIDEAQLHLYNSCTSTNDIAKALARQGAPHGTAVLAEGQTAGRGRLGRSFLSPTGGIYLSVILRPQLSAQELMPLTALLAASAMDAVEEALGIRPQVKWVNDLILQNRKLAGILTEPAFQADGTLNFVVCGIGLNCNTDPQSWDAEVRAMATSLKAATGKEQDPQILAALLIKHMLLACRSEEKERLLQSYKSACVTLGKEVRVLGAESYTATAVDMDMSAALIVRDARGVEHAINAGEVSVRGLYGYL